MKQNIVVLYHGDCRDGFSGAWAAWKKFGKKASYYGLQYGINSSVKLPEGIKNKVVYIIDFGLKEGRQMEDLVKANKKVVVLDHHHGATKKAKLATEYRSQMNHSGAVITWQYFHTDKPVPQFFKYVEDLDIWRHSLPHTFAVSTYVDLFNFDFNVWSMLVKRFENKKSLAKIFEQGKLILEYEDKKIKELVDNHAELVNFLGHNVLAVNSLNWVSKIGNLLCRKKPPFGIIWSKRREYISVSLRSKIGRFDVSKIAHKFGGGGHKAAARFSVKSIKGLPWKTLTQ
ncbi:MAG: DHHA1 domain-containing protein [bacterium]|nr:DHHA1 domain-containing protein [bacterium]